MLWPWDQTWRGVSQGSLISDIMQYVKLNSNSIFLTLSYMSLSSLAVTFSSCSNSSALASETHAKSTYQNHLLVVNRFRQPYQYHICSMTFASVQWLLKWHSKLISHIVILQCSAFRAELSSLDVNRGYSAENQGKTLHRPHIWKSNGEFLSTQLFGWKG